MRVAISDFFASFAVDGGQARLGPRSSLRDITVFPSESLGDSRGSENRLLDGLEIEPQRLAIVSGSSKGDLHALAAWSDHQTLDWTPDALGTARRAGIFLSPNAACATGAHTLSLGAGLIRSGRVDAAFCQSIEPPQHPLILAAYRNMGALSKTGIMRPFDARRDGFVPNWGVGALLLESETHARARGAQVHGFLTGYSLRCDAHHMTSMHPSGDGIARAIRDALRMANHPKIDYINAHGTATRNDAIESRAICDVFGDGVPVSSTKALTGHLLGASGVVEAAICLRAMQDGFAPPTLNLHEPNGDLDYLPLVGREMEMGAVLSLNYGFGGHIGALILEKY